MRAKSFVLATLVLWEAGITHAQDAAVQPQSEQGAQPASAQPADAQTATDASAAATAVQPSGQNIVTLPELEHIALKNRPLLDADAASMRGAEADVRKARAAYHPTLSLEGQTSVSPGRQLFTVASAVDPDQTLLVQGTPTLDEPGAFKPQIRYGVGLELRANIYDFGRTGAAVDAARAAREATEAGGEVTRVSIMRAVRGTYLAWLGAHELFDVAARAAQDATERRGRVEALIREGVRPRADLSPAVSDELLAQLELERAQADVSRRLLALEQAVGSPLPASPEPDRTLLEMYELRGPERDPERRALELQREAALATARAHDNSWNPTIGGAASIGTQAQADLFFPVYNAGLHVSVPLWNGGAAGAAADSARAKASNINARLQDHESDRSHAMREAQLQGEHAARRLSIAEALLASCRTQIEEAEARYEAGVSGIEPIAVARTMLRRAQTEVVLAKIARAEAALRAGL